MKYDKKTIRYIRSLLPEVASLSEDVEWWRRQCEKDSGPDFVQEVEINGRWLYRRRGAMLDRAVKALAKARAAHALLDNLERDDR